MKQIILQRGPEVYTATYTGDHRAEIVRLFGTDTLPTAYAANADAASVAEAIRRENPGCLVSTFMLYTY